MKILVISQYFYPEKLRVNTLCRELALRGHQVTVLTGFPQYPGGKIYPGYGFKLPYEHSWNGVSVERVKMKPRGKTPIGLLDNCISFVREANKWVDKCEMKYDAVYVYGLSPVTVGLPAISYKNKFDAPVFFNVQDLWPDSVREVLGVRSRIVTAVINRIVDKIYNNSDKILCSSKSFVETIAQRGVSSDRLVFWPQFCDEPDFESMVKPACYDNNEFNIVFTGNIGNAQGLDLLVDAASEMKDDRVKWYIVGDGRSRNRIQKKAEAQGTLDKIVFVGRVSEEEADRYVHFADCAYLSFKESSFLDKTIPAKMQTYLACGTPVLVAAGGENAKIISENKCGFVAERNVKSVCEVINKIMSLTKEETDKIRNNCRNYFIGNFTKEKLISELEDLMEKEVKKYENTAN